jgi:hypothetical protein
MNYRSFYIPKTVLDPTIRMDLNSLSETDCRKFFHLSPSEIRHVIVLLQLPDVIITPVHHDRVYVMEAFCLLSCHLSYPNRWFDLSRQFCQHERSLCRIFYFMMHIVLSKIQRNLLFFYPTGEELQEFANAFASHGVADTIKFWALIDVKKHQIIKPTMKQRVMYSGHKRIHCIKYQTLEVPNGLILHCTVGDDGHRGDGFVLRKSGLIPFLHRHSIVFGLYRILGDSAYPNNDVMLSVFKGNPARLPPRASAFNNIV